MAANLSLTYIFESILRIMTYLPVTLRISVIPTFVGILLGLAVALVRIYRIPVLRQLAAVYVSFIRGTPLLVQLFLVYYGLPWLILRTATALGVTLTYDVNLIVPEYFVLFAFSINMGAYLSETLRSAIESVDKGQFEAAQSIGLSSPYIMLKIVLPQAAVTALPNLSNSLISMVKDSSLAFMVTVVDIMGAARIMGARNLRYLELYISVSLVYWLVCIVLEQVFNLTEKRLKIGKRGLVE
jgi:L-cystine transport system permease protein